MKRAAIIYYTDRGEQTAARIARCIGDDFEIEQYRSKCAVDALFSKMDALIFIGACGIAVRAIAPCLRGKSVDPAVLVCDERGGNVISLLSGHIGGANALTRKIAADIGANPVITTATDVNRRFAADEWAAQQKLTISSMAAAKRFAVEILKRDLPLMSDFPVCGALPSGVILGDAGDCGLVISCRNVQPFDTTLTLIPRILHLGIGCKRGTPAEAVEAAVRSALTAAGLRLEALCSVASIDVKSDEAGLIDFCRDKNLPLRFYSAVELSSLVGDFSASAFVKHTVGVDNVCERSAMRSAGENAKLIVQKYCLNGVTVAAAQEEWSVRFE